MRKSDSHIEATDYLSGGNREVDLLARERPARLRPSQLIIPPEWKDGKTGLTKLPQPDRLSVLKQIHEGLGHVGGDRVVQRLRGSGLDIHEARGIVINFRKSYPECA